MFRLHPFLRTFEALMVFVLVASMVWTFKVKNDTEDALDRLAELEKQIAAEKNEIEILKSDWGLLTSPARLQKLYDLYGEELKMQGIEPGQIVDLDTLPPFRNPVPLESGNDEAHAGSISNMHTGGISTGGHNGQ